jgi:hypothetical protein
MITTLTDIVVRNIYVLVKIAAGEGVYDKSDCTKICIRSFCNILGLSSRILSVLSQK